MKRILSLATAVLIGMSSPVLADDTCGRVTIADMNWSSATLIAHVDKFILTHGYGCKAELVPGDTMPTGTSMSEKGEPDIAPEFWTSNFKAALAKGIEEKRLREAGNAFFEGGEEGFWVPAYMVEKDPSLATIDGIKKNAKLFEHPEDPDKSAFMACPAGWGCQLAVDNLFDVLGMADAGFEKVDPGSGAALAGSIAKAYERGIAWLGYYWAPTAVLGKYKMVKVDFGSGTDADYFYGCLAKPDCDNKKASMFPPSPVKTLTTESFAQRAPEAYTYLSKRAFKNADTNQMLAWMEDQQADGDIAMEHFLKNYKENWKGWVSKDAAQKIEKALAELY